ncbi:MAG TPA: heavy metal-associated domain-containing protein [Deinococcales bacterium]|nr:heavy metal-associated domain-containing protein [Deinococcales bacterium]
MTIVLKIEGMTCGHCQAAVAQSLNQVPGVRSARVNLRLGEAHVEGEALTPAGLIAAVEAQGYGAPPSPR